MLLQLLSSRFRRIFLITGVALLLPVHTLAQPRRNTNSAAVQEPPTSSIQSTLDLALYYYNNDDLSNRAEQSFKQLLNKKYENTPQYEAARYYLAAYYQRKFYLQRAKRRFDDWATLKQSASEYRNYTDKFYKSGNHTWLSDSFFNLAMVYLQLGEYSNAVYELSKMKEAAERDPTVYIYQIIWSAQSQDVIDSYLPSMRLADYSISVLNPKDIFFERAISFEKTVLLIQKWCQGQKIKTR